MTIIKPCANFTGVSCEGPAVLSNFRTASDPTRLGFCVFSCQAAGAKAQGHELRLTVIQQLRVV